MSPFRSAALRKLESTVPAAAVPAGTLTVELHKRHVSTPASCFQLDATFAAAAGVTAIIGHSGAGKTTILRCIAGLTEPQEGRIAIGERVLFDARRGINLEPVRRKAAFVFQDLALFPHLSVQDNVLYGLRHLDAAERQSRMQDILESFQIAHLCGRSTRQISGGEQQRVALARSLVTEPSVLLLDEPLSSLDSRTKVRIIEDLQRWNQTRRIPILYVTHDHNEVLAMADRVIAMEQGKIAAEGLPIDVLPAPARMALAQPAGFENVFEATVVERREQEGTMVCRLNGTSVLLGAPLAQAAVGSEVSLGVRAGDILVSASQPSILSACQVIPGKIKHLAPAGSMVEARVGGGAEFRVRMDARSAASHGLDVSADVWMMIGSHACHLVRPDLFDSLQRLFLFVCQANTARSAMAQALCNAEIASRFGVPLEALDRLGIKALSAGLTARPGEPIAAPAEQALGRIGLPAPQHRSRNLTQRLVQKAEAIFCMTEEQRRQLTDLFPATRPKAYLLQPDADIADPHGTALDGFIECALQMQAVLRRRLDGLGVRGTGGRLEWA